MSIYNKAGHPQWSEEGFTMFEAARHAIRARERGHCAAVSPGFDAEQLAELRARGLGKK